MQPSASLALMKALTVCTCMAADPPHACSYEKADYGKPAFFPGHDGLAYGASVRHSTFPKDQKATIYIWLSNESQSQQDYLMCCEFTFLKRIEVYDASGVRLESAWDSKLRNAREKHQQTVEVCSCSAWRTVAAGACAVVDEGTINRKDTAYDLGPGRYAVGERELSDQENESRSANETRHEGNELTIVVDHK